MKESLRDKLERVRWTSRQKMREPGIDNTEHAYHKGRAVLAMEVLEDLGNFEGGVSGVGQAPKQASLMVASHIPQDPFSAGPAPEYPVIVGQDAHYVVPDLHITVWLTWEDK